MEEEKSVATDIESVADEKATDIESVADEKITPDENTEKTADGPAETGMDSDGKTALDGSDPSEKDVTEKLRDATDTIKRAAAEAESFKRRRGDIGAADTSDEDKKREEELKRLADEMKRRESSAEERRIALEYAENYRAKIRSERESAAAKKREEDKERIRKEERAVREAEIKADIEREKEAARARSAKAESLLERIGGDVGAIGVKSEASADDFFSERKGDLPINVESSDTSLETEKTSAIYEKAAPVTSDFIHTDAKTVAVADESEGESSPTAGTHTDPGTEEKSPETDATAKAATDKAEDYVITVDGGHSGGDLLYIEGAVACEIEIAPATPVTPPTPTPPASPVTPDTSYAYKPDDIPPAEVESTVEVVVPAAKSTPYGDFPEPTDAKVEEPSTDKPSVCDADEKFEEIAELDRHSKEMKRAKKTKKTKKEEKSSEIPEYPDPDPIPSKKKHQKTKEERRAERQALLDFERDSRSKKPFGERKKTDEDREVEALEEFADDEAARREIAAVELGDSKTKAESPKTLEVKHVFDKKSLEKNKARQVKNDILFIEHRIYNDIRRLEMDTHTGAISFTAKIEDNKKKKARGRSKTALANTRQRLKEAVRYEKADNERYYYLTLTDVENVKLPRKTDREEVKKAREELMALLKRRDELNIKLIELYSLSEGGKGKVAEGRFKAILKAKKAAYKKQLPSFKKYEKAKLSREDKEKLYPLLDERTELYGELARVDYALKKERAKGLARKELRRERAKITRQLGENKRAILHYESKALKRADKEAEKTRGSILGWTVLAILVIGAICTVIFWNSIKPWFTDTALPWIGDAFAKIIGWITSLIGGGASADSPIQ